MDTRLLGIAVNSQARRRGLVLTLYASYALLVTCFALASATGPGFVFTLALLPVGLLLVFAFLALSQIALPYSSEGVGVTLPPLDERQVQVRDRAFYRAYQILASIFGLWIVYESIARDMTRQWFWFPSTTDEYQAIVWGYLLVAMTLPSAVIAWTEPDAVRADADDLEVRLAR